ncbi:serine threonine kinase-like domain-containing STKLD1 [Schistosoma japonicum]|nr:serine threonine kinase-like domain-containing STKLD1 [Schistosoma japonicum]
MEAKITYLYDNFEHENCIEKAVTWFAGYIHKDNHINLPYELLPHLFRLIYLYQSNLSIVTSCLKILTYSVESEQLHCMSAYQRHSCEDVNNLSHNHLEGSNHLKNLCKTSNLYLVLSIMQKCFQCTNVQNLGLTFFNSLISTNYSTTNLNVIHDYLQTYDRIFKKLHKINLCYHIIELLKCSTMDMIKIGINYLWRFCIYKPIAQKAAQDGALSISLQLMQSNQFDCEIFTDAPILIVSLLNVEEVKNRITEYTDLIHILLHGLIQFKNLPVTIWNICLCLQIVMHLSGLNLSYNLRLATIIQGLSCKFQPIYKSTSP